MKINYKKIGFISIGVIITIAIIALIVINLALNPLRSNKNQVEEIAKQETPIKEIKKTYSLSRDVKSSAVLGTNNSKNYYFIYLPKTKKGYLYQDTKGLSEKQILAKFNKSYPNQEVTDINLGWYKKRAVWEVSYKKSNSKLGFVIYNFKNGKEISYIDNL